MNTPRTYRFADASRPGLLLGLAARQALPLAAGVLWLAVVLQSRLPIVVGLAGPIAGGVVAFGRWRGTPLSETLLPGARLWLNRPLGHARWTRPPLLGIDLGDAALPRSMRGLELLEVSHPDGAGTSPRIAVVRDRPAGTVTGVLRVHGTGFPLASPEEQDTMLGTWGAALTPFARERSPVSRVVWQEWAHPVGDADHRDFLNAAGVHDRTGDEVADYLALLDQQAPATIAHDVLVTVTVEQRRVRTRRNIGSRWAAAVDALLDELRLLTTRLDAAGITADGLLAPPELASAVRLRSDPTRAAQLTTLTRSLAAAVGRGAIEWGPMVVEPDWSHVRVDAVVHRSYRVASWPQLPVPGDWLGPLLSDARSTRTVCVVMEPVPMSRAARAADREVMARETDAELKERKGFRVNARERRRLADVEARERELSEGHAEFRFVGLVDITAPDDDSLDEACGLVEQAAAQSLVDLRPLEARHEQAWVACLPLGRNLAGRVTP